MRRTVPVILGVGLLVLAGCNEQQKHYRYYIAVVNETDHDLTDVEVVLSEKDGARPGNLPKGGRATEGPVTCDISSPAEVRWRDSESRTNTLNLLHHVRRDFEEGTIYFIIEGKDSIRIKTIERGDSEVAVPPFEINVVLSEAAAKKLKDAGESISGIVFFDGDGIPKPKLNTAPFRSVFLGEYEFELKGAGRLLVTNAVVSANAVKRLRDTDYYFTVNVSSGRHVFSNNVIDDGVAMGRMSEAIKAPIEVKCGLLPN